MADEARPRGQLIPQESPIWRRLEPNRSPGGTEWEIPMARKRSRTAVLKRQREVKKSEKQALKREKREMRKEAPELDHEGVATRDDLAGYGFAIDDVDEPDSETSDD